MAYTFYEETPDEYTTKKAIAESSPVLGKWLWILFWLVVPTVISGLMKSETIMNAFPGIYRMGQILGITCSLAYGAILLKLSPAEQRYRTAGNCALISVALGIPVIILFGASDTPPWALFITVPETIIGLSGEYNEYNAHSVVLFRADHELSEKWLTLWKWYVGFMAGMLSAVILALMAPPLGLAVLSVCSIGVSVSLIIKLIYLYRTARLFREYAANPSLLE